MVNIKKYFIEKSINKVAIDEYLAKHFYRAGYAGVDIQRTPLGSRVIIYAERPAIIIGRRGAIIKQLAQIFEKHFGLENPQITVTNVENPELNARIMAFRLAMALERGYHFRRAAFAALRRIMAAGALGAEVVISGKLTSERARYEKIRAGRVYKVGQQVATMVDRAIAHALLKPGIYGVEVTIVKPVKSVDQIVFKTPTVVSGEKPQELPQAEGGGASS